MRAPTQVFNLLRTMLLLSFACVCVCGLWLLIVHVQDIVHVCAYTETMCIIHSERQCQYPPCAHTYCFYFIHAYNVVFVAKRVYNFFIFFHSCCVVYIPSLIPSNIIAYRPYVHFAWQLIYTPNKSFQVIGLEPIMFCLLCTIFLLFSSSIHSFVHNIVCFSRVVYNIIFSKNTQDMFSFHSTQLAFVLCLSPFRFIPIELPRWIATKHKKEEKDKENILNAKENFKRKASAINKKL